MSEELPITIPAISVVNGSSKSVVFVKLTEGYEPKQLKSIAPNKQPNQARVPADMWSDKK